MALDLPDPGEDENGFSRRLLASFACRVFRCGRIARAKLRIQRIGEQLRCMLTAERKLVGCASLTRIADVFPTGIKQRDGSLRIS
jgi:hypothetical protein